MSFIDNFTNNQKDKDNIKTQFSSDQINAYFKFLKQDLTASDITTKVTQIDASEYMVWDRDEWDNTTGTNVDNWSDNYTGSQTVLRVVTPNNSFFEDFIDSDFLDTSSTATISSGSLVFSGTQTASSEIIYKNNITLTSAKITAIDNGSVNYYLSADGGSNWESVTNGTTHSFSNTGQELKWRAISTASTSISSLIVTY